MVEEPRPATRHDVLALEAEADRATAERIKPDVLRFIRGEDGPIMGYLITLRKDGRPTGRPVSTFIEGWKIGTISQYEHLKNRHIENNPEVAYLFTELNPKVGSRPRSVFVQGKCDIIKDADTINAFFERRKAVKGMGDAHPDEDWTRLLLLTSPTYVRAEGFLQRLKPAVYREFAE